MDYWALVKNYWWLPTTGLFFLIFWRLWLYYIQERFARAREWVLLEIEIPEGMEKTPKSMEQVLAGLHGVAKGGNLLERYVQGFLPRTFSLEILGKNGEMRFFIRTIKNFRNLAESQIYAQYPEAEIKEVADYTKEVPQNIPSKDWTLWASETSLTGDNPYLPIRTYPHFQEEEAPAGFLDPLANLAELISNLGPKEQIWYQIIIEPTHRGWRKEAEKEISKIIGEEVPEEKKDLVDKLGYKIFQGAGLGQSAIESATWKDKKVGLPEKKQKEEDGSPSLMQYLSPREREKAELMGKKIAKLGCNTLIRFAYLANPQEFDGSNISGFWGALKQYAFEDLNGFRPDAKTKTSINYFFENSRKKYRCRKNIKRYRSRSVNGERFILNLEEIASLFHFPGPVVESPGLSRRTTRKRGAPGRLPTK